MHVILLLSGFILSICFGDISKYINSYSNSYFGLFKCCIEAFKFIGPFLTLGYYEICYGKYLCTCLWAYMWVLVKD